MPESLPASAASNPRAAGDEDVFYPSSDGKPMAENTWQAQAIMHAASDLAVALPEPFVAADILVYPEQGIRRTPSPRTCWWPSAWNGATG